MHRLFWIGCFVSLLAGCAPSEPAANSITMATTTSTRDSGLMDVLVPKFEAQTGIEVKLVAVGSGQALEMVAAMPFDLVVCDVDMPRVDGFEFTEAVRKTSDHAQLPVILVTARGSEEDRIRGLKSGANAYLVKSSFDQSRLLEVISELL